MRSEFGFYLAVSMAAFCIGCIIAPDRNTLNLASEESTPETQTSINSYDTLPCPSVEAIQKWKKRVQIDFGDRPLNCDDPYAEKFLKLLELASTLKIDLPQDWGGQQRESLTEPLEYIFKMTQRFVLEIDQKNTVASNYLGQRILLGGQFFNYKPLDALQVLIHESRHSSILDPKHVDCRTGDLPKTPRACDQFFSVEHDAGAYSYGFVFQLALGLFGQNLSDSDREYLRDSALFGITRRFNRVPEWLALPLDIIFVLKDDKIYKVQPFTLGLTEIDIPHEWQSDRPARLQYEPISQGVLVFTEGGRIFSIDPFGKFLPYYADLIPSGPKWIDSNKVYSSGESYSHTYFLDANNQISYKDVDINGRDVLRPFRHQPPIRMKRLFTADIFSFFLLSQDGQLYTYQSNARGPHGDPFRLEKDFAILDQHWLDVTGGATYDQIIGVSSDGLVYTNIDEDKISGVRNSPSRLMFKSNSPLVKFQEGLNIKVGLSQTGQIFVHDYAESTDKPWTLPFKDVQDFAIGRLYTGIGLVNSERRLTSAELQWAAHCTVEKPMINPWTDQAFGLNSRGYLVFFESSKPCQEAIHITRARTRNLRLMGSDLYKSFNYFSQVHLELESTTGSTIKRFPYTPLYSETRNPY